MLQTIVLGLALIATFFCLFEWINHWIGAYHQHGKHYFYNPFKKELFYGILAIIFWCVFYYLNRYCLVL